MDLIQVEPNIINKLSERSQLGSKPGGLDPPYMERLILQQGRTKIGPKPGLGEAAKKRVKTRAASR